MNRVHVHSLKQLLFLLTFFSLCFMVLSLLTGTAPREKFVSSEITFTDLSSKGLSIMPASCASSPTYTKGALSLSADGRGYISYSGQTEFGATKNGLSICITNTSGSSYFIPANTAAEMQAVKNLGSSKPGLVIY